MTSRDNILIEDFLRYVKNKNNIVDIRLVDQDIVLKCLKVDRTIPIAFKKKKVIHEICH